MSDFNYRILEETSHRPWPVPTAPWVMTQTWHELLFAHWPVNEQELKRRVPPGLPLDLYEGQAWLGIVPFRMTNVAPRGIPNVPFVSSFPELNVRTYVSVDGKPGVYFFSLDAGSAIAVAAARTLLGLPYFPAVMRVDRNEEEVRYESVRQGGGERAATFTSRYRPAGPVDPPRAGSIEYFLTERYCLYRVDGSSRTHRLEIHHPPWPLQIATATIERNTMADAAGIRLPPSAPLLHYAHRQDMVAWAPVRIVNRKS
jgi:uncharacterized protein YqjF (DUF2071 family)